MKQNMPYQLPNIRMIAPLLLFQFLLALYKCFDSLIVLFIFLFVESFNSQ